jgi:hypothetical protein
MRWTLALAVLAGLAGGCGANCAEIAARKRALTERTAVAAGPHARVHGDDLAFTLGFALAPGA